MAIDIEGLEFEIEAKSGEAEKGIDSLAKSLERLKKATKGGMGLTSSVKQLEKLEKALDNFHPEKLEKLGKALESLSGASNVKISATVPKRISDIASAANQLDPQAIENLERLGNALQNIGAAGNVRIPNINQTGGGTQGGTNPVPGAADSGTGAASQQTQELTGKFVKLRSVLSSIGGVFSKAFSTGVGALKKLGSAAGSTAKKLAAMPFRAIKNQASQMAAKVKQCTSSLGSFFSSIKRIAMYRAIRFALSQLTQAFKDGMNNLYQYSLLMGGTFSQSMNSLATDALYLKNSLGAMVAPLIESLAPAIDYITEKIANLLNLISQLIAKLTGKSTYTAAKKVATAYADAADDAADSAKKAADKIKSYTAGIDELNIFQDTSSDSSSGASDSGTDYSSMFEELPIDSSLGDFADRLRQAFEDGDWESLGRLLGDKINTILDNIDWNGIGHKIGKALNGAIQTAYYFLDELDFYALGNHVADLLNGAMEEIDFSFVGRLLVKPFTSLIDFLIGFVEGLDWALLATSLSDLVEGVFDELTDWLNSYDWTQLGSNLWQHIKDFFGNIDYGGLATSFFTFLGTAIRSAAQFLYGFFGSIAGDIKNWWDTDIKGTSWTETAGNLLKAIGKGFVNIGTWVWDNIIDPFMSALLGEKWDDLKDCASNIWESIKTGWNNLKDKTVEFFANVKNNAATWWSNVKSWWSGKVGTVSEFATNVKNDASTWWSSVKTWWGNKVGAVQNFTTSVTNSAATWWSNVKSWWSGKVGAVKDFTTAVTDQSSTWWSNVKSWWSGKVGAVKNFTTAVTDQSSTWWANVKSWWSGKVGAVQQFTTSVKDESSTWWSNVKSWWSGKVGAVQQFTTSVKDESSTWWSNTKSYWSGKVGAVQQFTTSVKNDASTWWSNVKTWWSGVVGNLSVSVAIKNEATTWWNNVKSWWSNAVGTLTTTLSIKVPKISVTWSTVEALGQTFKYPSGFNLTWNAKGGILDGAQLFGRLGDNFLGGGEAGKEAVLPLESHTEWMDTLAEKVRDGLPDDDDSGGITYEGMKRALADFYEEYVQGTMNQMANDMSTQANKKEQTVVKIGNRTVSDAVVTQQNADGYRFTTT
jgi:hypothetical protein